MKHTGARIALALIASAILAGLLPVAWLGVDEGEKVLDTYTLRVITFTLWQALLSTTISAVLGVAAAFALARRQFWGRAMLIKLLALPMALPAIVVVLGIIGIFGAQGLLPQFFPLYGLGGILLAHVFFNVPLVARLTLSALTTVPAEQLRLAAQLGFSDLAHFRHVDWPVLRQALPGTLLLVFLLCTASFTIVLTLGGGPQATTLEVAIYQALRFDFDPARATLLALVQIALCGALGFGAMRFSTPAQTQGALRLALHRYDGQSVAAKLMDFVVILVLAVLLLPPLAVLVASGIMSFSVQTTFLTALVTSLMLAGVTAVLACLLAWLMATGPARLSTLASQASLVLPPAVIATGWFILVSKGPGLSAFAIPLIISLNSLMALPFAYNALAPALRGQMKSHDRLCASLGIAGWNRFWHIELPAAAAPLSLALAMAALVSLGDLSSILFFGNGQYVTLPALVYLQMGSYRMEGAMGTALVLAFISFAMLWAAESWSRHHA